MTTMADSVRLMTNKELNGLAQNRFTDPATQVAIAHHPYKLCREYLASNQNLCKEARDILWNKYRGYVLKSIMVGQGHYAEEPEKYRELYNIMSKSGHARCSPWRFTSAFVRNYFALNQDLGPHATPPDIVEALVITRRNVPKNYYGMRELAKHPNLTLKAACILSLSEDPTIKQIAFNRMAELKNEEG